MESESERERERERARARERERERERERARESERERERERERGRARQLRERTVLAREPTYFMHARPRQAPPGPAHVQLCGVVASGLLVALRAQGSRLTLWPSRSHCQSFKRQLHRYLRGSSFVVDPAARSLQVTRVVRGACAQQRTNRALYKNLSRHFDDNSMAHLFYNIVVTAT